MLLSANGFLILACAFPVQVLVARYLGPTALGIYAFVLSFSNLARVVVAMGLQDILIPLYKRRQQDSLFGTALLMRKLASLVLLLVPLCWLMVCHLKADQSNAQLSLMIAVVLGSYLFSDHEIFSIWCKSEGRLFSLVAVDLGGTLVGLGLRLAVIWFQGSMIMLLASYVCEQIAKLFIAAALYLRNSRPFLKPFSCSKKEAGELFLHAWPIWLAAMLGVAQTRLDQILLGALVAESSQLGQYSVAYRLIEAMSAGAVAIFTVYLPILARSEGPRFQQKLQRMHDLALLASLGLGLPFYLFLEPVVTGLYGPSYADAANLALLLLWLLPANYLTFCRSAFLYSLGLQKYELWVRAASVVLSLSLNLAVIPLYGAAGAAAVAVGVQWLVFLLPIMVIPDLRPLLRCLGKAALLPLTFRRTVHWFRAERLSENEEG